MAQYPGRLDFDRRNLTYSLHMEIILQKFISDLIVFSEYDNLNHHIRLFLRT